MTYGFAFYHLCPDDKIQIRKYEKSCQRKSEIQLPKKR